MKILNLALAAVLLTSNAPAFAMSTCTASCHLEFDKNGGAEYAENYQARGMGSSRAEALANLIQDCDQAAVRAGQAWNSKRDVTHFLITHSASSTGSDWDGKGNYKDQRFSAIDACVE